MFRTLHIKHFLSRYFFLLFQQQPSQAAISTLVLLSIHSKPKRINRSLRCNFFTRYFYKKIETKN